MINQWKKDKGIFIKETDTEFIVVTCLTFVGAENNEYMYGPTLHKINKLHYPISSIDEITKSILGNKAEDMSLAEKIMYLSAFIGLCEDIEDENSERIWFTFDNNRQGSDIEIEEKLFSIIKELNL